MPPPIEPAIIINCVLSLLFNWLGTIVEPRLELGLELGLGVSEEEENEYTSKLEVTNFWVDEQSDEKDIFSVARSVVIELVSLGISWDEKDIFSVARLVVIELVSLGISWDEEDIFSVALVVVDCWVIRCWDEEDLLSVELSCNPSFVVELVHCWDEEKEEHKKMEDWIPSAHFVVATEMIPLHVDSVS